MLTVLGHLTVAAALLTTGARTPQQAAPVDHKIYGFAQSLAGTTLVIKTRTGAAVKVDTHLAHANLHLFRGRPVIVSGPADAAGTIHATSVWRTYPDAAHWPADR